MKRKIFGLCFILFLTVFAAIPVLAWEDYGSIYDATGQLDADTMKNLSETTLTALSDRYGIEARVDIVTGLEGNSISDYAGMFYDKYDYGYGDTDDGILLMLLIHTDETGLAFDQYEVYYGGEAATLFNDEFKHTLETALDISFSREAWSGDLAQDNAVCAEGIASYAAVLDNILGSVLEAAEPAANGGENAAAGGYFSDELGLLTEEELSDLNLRAREISELYHCGVYGMIVADFRDYNSESVYEAAKTIYTNNNFGYGDQRDGVFLLLSMEDRDYSLIAYGDAGNGAFTDYGKEKLSDAFLDDFGDDDWYGGFLSYISGSEKYLSLYDEGTPYDVGSASALGGTSLLMKLLLIVVLPVAIALAICLYLKRAMKTVAKGSSAINYLDQSSISYKIREDQFSHITEVITAIPESNSGGGTSVDGGGFSGRSGKF